MRRALLQPSCGGVAAGAARLRCTPAEADARLHEGGCARGDDMMEGARRVVAASGGGRRWTVAVRKGKV